MPVIPQPEIIRPTGCRLDMRLGLAICCSSEHNSLAENFIARIRTISSLKIGLSSHTSERWIPLILNKVNISGLSTEGYELQISSRKIELSAPAEAGLFYGLQTLTQLIFHYPRQLPGLSILDNPRFPWRGLHLDVSRHFFPISFIRKYLDLMALHKLNRFHWHLTDDNGWRLPSLKYPRLNEIASWREDLEHLPWQERDAQQGSGSRLYGGFYTPAELEEVVEYASQRGIEVIPEVEMPGHSREILAALPELSCRRSQFTVAPGSCGPDPGILCAGREATFSFLENVLTEVMNYFPGKYLHIGGDEAVKTSWRTCPDCRRRMAEEKLKTLAELQNYFMTRMSRWLKRQGRQAIVWDEILQVGLPADVTVMAWRKDASRTVLKALSQGHEVIACPNPALYFDWRQTTDPGEKGAFGVTTIRKVYDYDPLPEAVPEAQLPLLLGAQGNLWTEFMTDGQTVEYMAYPRTCALAETVWSRSENKNFKTFKIRLSEHLKLLAKLEVNFCATIPEE